MAKKSIRFPDDLENQISDRAQELERSFSWVVIDALKKESDEWRKVDLVMDIVSRPSASSSRSDGS